MGDPAPADDKPEDKDGKLARAAKASSLATATYFCIALGHTALVAWHYQSTKSAGILFACLAVMEGTLAFESIVYGLGAFGRASTFKPLVTAGRVQKLSQAIAWPWLLPWVAELGCRCGTATPEAGAHSRDANLVAAGVLSAFYLLREFSFAFRGEPASAADGNIEAQFGDCLPSQAVLGGHFRLDKQSLERTGRALFVPARERWGLFIGSGLAVLSHLYHGVSLSAHRGGISWVLVGVLAGIAGRKIDPIFELASPLWKVEGPRLVERVGELVWLGCCVLEIQRWEASATFLESC
jgi:hypothetical protein